MKVGSHNQQTTDKTIALDYLEISFKIEIPTFEHMPKSFNIDKHIRMEFIDTYKSQYFNVIANLFIDDRLVGELKYAPSTPFLDENLIHLKIENCHLYSNSYLEYIQFLIESGFKFNGIVRIDIATDSIKTNLLDFLKQYQHSNLIIAKGRAKDITTKTLGKEYKTVYWGSTKSNKYIKIYNKSVELLTKAKPYINYFYKINGLDYENNEVERLELTLKGIHTKTIELKRLTDANYLASICQTHFKNYFEFQSNFIQHGKRIKKDCTPVTLKEFKTMILPKYKQVNKHTTLAHKAELKRLHRYHLSELELAKQPQHNDNKDAMKVYDKTHLFTFLLAIERLCQLYQLKEYYEKNKKYWEKEYNDNQSKK